jgi:hypothetical protein
MHDESPGHVAETSTGHRRRPINGWRPLGGQSALVITLVSLSLALGVVSARIAHARGVNTRVWRAVAGSDASTSTSPGRIPTHVLVLRPGDCAQKLAIIDALNAAERHGGGAVGGVLVVRDGEQLDLATFRDAQGIRFPLRTLEIHDAAQFLAALHQPRTPLLLTLDRTGALVKIRALDGVDADLTASADVDPDPDRRSSTRTTTRARS